MPPHRNDTGAELSLRHLPDISDASFSFQIPNFLSQEDLLLADDDDVSFFRGANDSMTTPGLSRIAASPLTLSELTPRPIRTHAAKSLQHQVQAQPSSLPALEVRSKPKSKRTPQGIGKTMKIRAGLPMGSSRPGHRSMRTGSSQAPALGEDTLATTRLDTLRTEVEMLDTNSHESSKTDSPHSHAKPLHDVASKSIGPRRERATAKATAKPKRTVISGGISKTRSKNSTSTSTLPRNIPALPNSQQQTSHVTLNRAGFVQDEENADESICSSTTGGVAERLVMYSQQLLSSFGPFMSASTASAPEINPELSAQKDEAIPETVKHVDHESDRPLTLSQISPSKRVSPQATSARPVSPTRPSTKRPASVTSTERASKKGKSTSATVDTDPAVSTAALLTSAASRAPAGSSSSGSRNVNKTTRPRDGHTKKSTRQVPASTLTRLGNGSQAAVPAALTRNDASSSGSSTLRFSRSDNLRTSGSSARGSQDEGKGPSTTEGGGASLPRRDKRMVVPPINPTKPTEFKFQMDARIEARKAENEKEGSVASQKLRKTYQVPDFKTLHALQDAELAHRKENIVPVIPVPLELNTDGRARERERFDEHIREKERELERAMEQKRREMEENEEREIRELRKKAVPKAHEVPEWYKEAPKRKKREVDSNAG
ncbi:hypothetical protein D9615_000920 [Tricholomella constricta]|uniref:TPX2 C-terminal domain-containing protein n=1 Tax=Tricholomella constricta TaxID=117010 RepID=A0A8H5M8Q6_9AGAR|nr:hypothetical protein D9615_000920 [Tricholomella constricta]